MIKKKKKWLFINIAIGFLVIISLLVYGNRKKLFPHKPPNPYKLNYTKISKLGEILDNGVSPNGDKTFLITFGSRNCPACTQLYQTMAKYNTKAIGKIAKDGYVPYFTTDVDLEYDDSIEFAGDYLLENKYRTWKNNEEKIMSSINDIVTPTTFFVQNTELVDIIVGASLDPEEIVNYVKEKH